MIKWNDYGNVLDYVKSIGAIHNIVNAEKLTTVEKAIIQRTKMFCEMLKIVASTTSKNGDDCQQFAAKGHFITFNSTNMEQFLEAFNSNENNDLLCKTDVSDSLFISFIGTSSQWVTYKENQFANMHRSRVFGVNGKKVLFWLRLLKHEFGNKYYANLNIPIRESNDELKYIETIQNIPKTLFENAIFQDSETVIDFEKKIGSDVAKVRTEQYAATSSLAIMDLDGNGESIIVDDESNAAYDAYFVTDKYLNTSKNVKNDDGDADIVDVQNLLDTIQNVNNKDPQKTTISLQTTSLKNETPMNEFEQNNVMMYLSFPWLFPTGQGLSIDLRNLLSIRRIFIC